jgi:putative phage-type endonuclease
MKIKIIFFVKIEDMIIDKDAKTIKEYSKIMARVFMEVAQFDASDQIQVNMIQSQLTECDLISSQFRTELTRLSNKERSDITQEEITNLKKCQNEVFQKIIQIDYILMRLYRHIRIKWLIEYSKTQPEQKSAGWLAKRMKIIGASETASAIGENHYDKSILDYIAKQVLPELKFSGNKFTQWGEKYEPIATQIYEYRYNAVVHEAALVIHPTETYIGASCDGLICTPDDGYILEIKCPFGRPPKKDIVPHHYWIQMQQQLEITDVETGIFWDCKMMEFQDYDDFARRRNTISQSGILCDTGIDTKDPMIRYIYPPLNMTDIDTMKFINDELQKRCGAHLPKLVYWGLKYAICVPVHRRRKWFAEKKQKIESSWKDKMYYKQHVEEFREIYEKYKRSVQKK